MTARETIFSRVRDALAPLGSDRAALPDHDPDVSRPLWLTGNAQDLFAKRLASTGARFFDSVPACVDWLTHEESKRLYISPGLEFLIPSLTGPWTLTSDAVRPQVDEIDSAITLAAGAIAESGTLILTDATTPDRLAAIAPWRHIAAVRRSTIFLTIDEAIAAMPPDPCVLWVTGPSKTADVEGILIQGVHGPGEQACLLIDS